LEFTAVEFGYERQARALHIPSLRIAAGKKVAIVGENGAGKSTLARLVTRLYDVKSGTIQVGGVDIREMALKDLRRSVCYLPRDPVLFEGTLGSNLRFVKPGASDRDLRKAIELADLDGVVAAFPAGLHQRLGPDACQLSGGQRQRLAIARALLQKPRIVILDEATSCLDPTSESLILRNVSDHLPTSTLIVVSHRASTLSGFRRVIVLAAGRIQSDTEREAPAFGPELVSATFTRGSPQT
jgi:ABC-type bacteriocin/lantibiotic exporter with double-glycine peptidase domain